MNKNKIKSNNWEVLDAYSELIKKLEAMEVGEQTEYKTEVTPELIATIKQRYIQLFYCKNVRTGIA